MRYIHWSYYLHHKDILESLNQIPLKSTEETCRHITLQWHHNELDGVSNHQPHACILKRLCRCRSKKTSKLHVTGLCAGNSPVTGEFLTQRASNVENVSICCHHHCSGSLEPEYSCHDRDWIMELPMEADILTFTGILTPEDASVASCFPFDITISLSWFPLLSMPPLHSAIP